MGAGPAGGAFTHIAIHPDRGWREINIAFAVNQLPSVLHFAAQANGHHLRPLPMCPFGPKHRPSNTKILRTVRHLNDLRNGFAGCLETSVNIHKGQAPPKREK